MHFPFFLDYILVMICWRSVQFAVTVYLHYLCIQQLGLCLLCNHECRFKRETSKQLEKEKTACTQIDCKHGWSLFWKGCISDRENDTSRF